MAFRWVGTRASLMTTKTANPLLPVNSTVATFSLNVKTTSPWVPLGAAFSKFAMRCVRGTSIGTSNWSVKLQGSLSTKNTTGAAVGAIGAYTPTVLIAMTQANVGAVKLSTSTIPAAFVRFSCTAFTTAANRSLRVEVCAVP